jgi:hypothetical protein
VWIGKTNGSEPLKTRRDEPIDVETEVDISLAISLEETCLLSRRHPAYRRRESDLGANAERGKLRPRHCNRGDHSLLRLREGEPQAAKSARARVPSRGMQWRTVP